MVNNMINLLIAIIATLFFCIFHSITTMDKVKGKFPLQSKYYRLFYNLIAGLTLIPLSILLSELSNDSLMKTSPLLVLDQNSTLILSILSIIGIIFVVGSIIQTNPLKFIGIQSETDEDLLLGYFYKFSRHPMYTGAILLLGPAIFTSSNFIWIQQNLIFVLYFIFGSIHEEYRLKSTLTGYESMYSRGQLFPWKKQHFKTLLGK